MEDERYAQQRLGELFDAQSARRRDARCVCDAGNPPARQPLRVITWINFPTSSSSRAASLLALCVALQLRDYSFVAVTPATHKSVQCQA